MIKENYYYVVKATWEQEGDNGKTKSVPEQYLVEAVSPTHAEAIVNEGYNSMTDFRVKAITEMKFNKIILLDNESE